MSPHAVTRNRLLLSLACAFLLAFTSIIGLTQAQPSLASWWNPLSWFGSDHDKPKPKPAAAKSADSKVTLLPSSDGNIPEWKGVQVETQRGTIFIKLFPTEAPKTVENFVKLVDRGFYNVSGMKFHRVIPGFVVQTGDPTGTGYGGSEKRVPLEVQNKLNHGAKGMVAMARGPDPNSATSQFYITLAPQKTLDGKYAVFGVVVRGYDALEAIQKDDKVYGVKTVDLRNITFEENRMPNDSFLHNFKEYFSPSKATGK